MQSDKYLASPPYGASITRDIYYRLVHSLRWLLSKFQPNQTRSFVFPCVEAGVVADFRKMEKERYRSVIQLLFLEGKSRSEVKEHLDAVYSDSSRSMARV